MLDKFNNILKVHLDLVNDFNEKVMKELISFPYYESRKFDEYEITIVISNNNNYYNINTFIYGVMALDTRFEKLGEDGLFVDGMTYKSTFSEAKTIYMLGGRPMFSVPEHGYISLVNPESRDDYFNLTLLYNLPSYKFYLNCTEIYKLIPFGSMVRIKEEII